MKIYVAGSYYERNRITEYMDRLVAAGHEVTRHWPSIVAAVGKPDHELTKAERALYAEGDLDGVYRAEIFWLVTPSALTKGAWIEFGYALALHRQLGVNRVLVSGAGPSSSIFLDVHDFEHYATHDEACGSLCAIGRST